MSKRTAGATVRREPTVIERRVAATEATLARFRDQPFAWGRHDCARMVMFHVRQLGWKPRVAKAGSYSTALGARRALARAGFDSLAAAIDAHGLPRIAPARVLVGDLILSATDEEQNHGIDVVGIALGNGRVLGWHTEADGATALQPLEILAAWQVLAPVIGS